MLGSLQLFFVRWPEKVIERILDANAIHFILHSVNKHLHEKGVQVKGLMALKVIHPRARCPLPRPPSLRPSTLTLRLFARVTHTI